MSMYPSLEDMKFDKLANAQQHYVAKALPSACTNYPTAPLSLPGSLSMYPSLGDYMGLELSQAMIEANMPEYQASVVSLGGVVAGAGTTSNMIAPLSGQSIGLHRAQVTNGIRELQLCKDKDGKVGVRVKSISNGIFVCLVVEKSPAALAGLRFGDQILEINGQTIAGYTMDKVNELFRKSSVNGISVVVRDRPFERTITLHKDSTGHVGFIFKNGKILSIVKDSSAAKNGLLTDHQILEIEGRNVIGLKDKEITLYIDAAGNVLTVTVIPTFMYDHMVKKMSPSLIKELMDHSIPML